MTAAVLSQADIPHEICPNFETLIHELGLGAAATLIPEEAITPANTALLGQVLTSQPPWSDLPVLVLTRPGADSLASRHAAETLGNVTLLERPLRVATLLSAIRTALRARDASTKSGSTWPNGSARNKHSARRTGGRTSSSRPWVTSCAIPWPH
jgi:two-component system, sensor histidine kinase